MLARLARLDGPVDMVPSTQADLAALGLRRDRPSGRQVWVDGKEVFKA